MSADEGKELEMFLAWIGDAETLVREWEAERGTMLATRDAAALTERIARALQSAAGRGKPRRRKQVDGDAGHRQPSQI
jgi:hypothetical protein